jgi:hypothetical protein
MGKNKQEIQEEKINALLGEYDNHRLEIKSMIEYLEKIKVRIDTLIPDKLDARYVRFFEEKVKSITGLFNTLLEMRKEIAKSIKDEIEIRRRIKNAEEMIDIEDVLDIRSMAKKIDEFKDQKNKLQEERIKNNEKQPMEDGIEIPGINVSVEGYRNDKRN